MKNKKQIFLITTLTLIILLTTVVTADLPAEVWVNNTHADQQEGPHFDTIQEAINAVAEGGTVNVFPGTYDEGIVIEKPLTLKSVEGPVGTIIEGIVPEEIFDVSVIVANDDVILEGFSIAVPEFGVASPTVHPLNSTYGNITITSSIFVCDENEENDYGLFLHNLKNSLIENNKFNDCGFGIYLMDSVNTEISSNDIHDSTLFGSTIYFSDNISFISNEIVGAGLDFEEGSAGILIDASNITLGNNNISNNVIGLYLIGDHNHNVTNNNLSNNYIIYMLFGDADYIDIEENIIGNNSVYYVKSEDIPFFEAKLVLGNGLLNIKIEEDLDKVLYAEVLEDWTITTGEGSSVTLPEGTNITKTGGGSFDLFDITALSDFGEGFFGGFDAGLELVQGFQFGVPETGLTFSDPIHININVGSELNGEVLMIQKSLDEAGPWVDDGLNDVFCEVSESVCNFETTRASYFVALDFPGIVSCQEINEPAHYVLLDHIESAGTCLTITSDNVIINGNGYNITYGTSGNSNVYGITSSGDLDNITIKNLIINEGSEGPNKGGINLESLNTNNNINIINNTINMRNDSNAITVSNYVDSLISDNTINLYGSDSAGLILFAFQDSNLTNNEFRSYGTSYQGLVSLGSESNENLINNNIFVSDNNWGIDFFNNSHNVLDNNTFNIGELSAISIHDSNHTYVSNNIITAGKSVRIIGNETYNNTFVKNTFNSFEYGLSLEYDDFSHSFEVIDSVFDSGEYDLFISDQSIGGEWNFTNVTGSDNGVLTINWTDGSIGVLNVFWYLDVLAEFNEEPFEGVVINVSDVLDELQFSQETSSEGLVSGKKLLEYSWVDGSQKTFYSMYNVSATHYIYETMYQEVNMSENKFLTFSFTPYEITDWFDLNNTREKLSAHYVLLNDLDEDVAGYDEIAGPDANQGKGWEPIGNESDPFIGVFDGNDFEISKLFINRSEDYVGLFGKINNEGIIKNLNLEDVEIRGDLFVGSLAGSNSGNITNVHSSGMVVGIVGTSLWIGGLIGELHEGNVFKSSSSNDVKGEGGVGGLIGYADGNSEVHNSYAAGNVEGNGRVGGFIALVNNSLINNSYSTGDVEGNNSVGGLVGLNKNGVINNSFSAGFVNGINVNSTGGLIGNNTGTVNNSFWDKTTSELEFMCGNSTGTGCDNSNGKKTSQMKTLSTFSDWNITSTETELNDGYPFLAWQDNVASHVWLIYVEPEEDDDDDDTTNGAPSDPAAPPSDPGDPVDPDDDDEDEETPSFWNHTHVVSDEEFQEGFSYSLKPGQRFSIDVDEETHYVGVVSVTNTTATINVSSTPQQKTLSIGEEWKVDVKDDGFYDVLVSLINIDEYGAQVGVERIHEEIEDVDVVTTMIDPEHDLFEKEKRGVSWIVWVILGLIVVLATIMIIHMYDKKRRGSNKDDSKKIDSSTSKPEKPKKPE